MVQNLRDIFLDMAIRANFSAATACLLLILMSGSLTLVAADPHSVSPDGLEQPAFPPVQDDFGLTDLTVERLGEDLGSGSAGQDLAQLTIPDGPFPEDLAPTADGSDATVATEPAAPDSSVSPPTEAAYHVDLNPQVQAFLDRFTGSRREIVGLWLSRSRQYLDMIRDVFRSRGLPEDLAFVAMIESGYNPLAVSRAGAKGLWQFMAGTARRYGLRVDQWVDERYDPEKSTMAAAAYLRDLYQQFGSWALAKAAYNAGELKIVRAMKIVGSTDFWTLATRSRTLKQETKDFVPAIHAATVIGRDPGKYGFDLAEMKSVDTETVAVPASTDLRKLSARAGISLASLRSLNPVLVKAVTPPGSPYELKVPVGTRDGVLAALAPRRPSARKKTLAAGSHEASVRGVHVVQARETVTSIARRYGVTVGDVLRWNQMEGDALIRPGDRLRIAGNGNREARAGAVAAR